MPAVIACLRISEWRRPRSSATCGETMRSSFICASWPICRFSRSGGITICSWSAQLSCLPCGSPIIGFPSCGGLLRHGLTLESQDATTEHAPKLHKLDSQIPAFFTHSAPTKIRMHPCTQHLPCGPAAIRFLAACAFDQVFHLPDSGVASLLRRQWCCSRSPCTMTGLPITPLSMQFSQVSSRRSSIGGLPHGPCLRSPRRPVHPNKLLPLGAQPRWPKLVTATVACGRPSKSNMLSGLPLWVAHPCPVGAEGEVVCLSP